MRLLTNSTDEFTSHDSNIFAVAEGRGLRS